MFKSSHLLNSLFMPTSLALAMMVVGCTDKPAANETEAGTDTSKSKVAETTLVAEAGATSKTATDELAEVQEFNYNNASEPVSLDPHKIEDSTSGTIVRQMFEGLVSTGLTGETVPGMAESWESEDNITWTFKLRDANWSNGDPVTAEDFAYSFRRAVNPDTASPYSTYLVDAKVLNAGDVVEGKASPDTLGVKAVDDKTFEVTLSEPVPYFPDTLFHFTVMPVHKATVEEFGDNWTDPANIVVNGAYKVTDWKVNDKIILKRNPAYYGNDSVTLDKVTLYAINDEASAVKRYETGELDVVGIPSEQMKSIQEKYPNEISTSPALSTYYFEFNNAKAPFDDVRVRRALSMALDRNIITDTVLGQGQLPAYQFTPPSTAGIENNVPEWSTWDREKQVAEAKKLFAEAGYNESNPLKFELLYNTSESHKKIAVAATSLWKSALGNIDITLANQEWKTFLDTKKSGNFEMARAGWGGDYNEASTFLNLMKSNSSNNSAKYNNPKFDDLMSQTLRPGVTAEQRANIYKQAEAQLDADMPVIPVYHAVGMRALKPYVKGYPLNDPLGNLQFKYISITKH